MTGIRMICCDIAPASLEEAQTDWVVLAPGWLGRWARQKDHGSD